MISVMIKIGKYDTHIKKMKYILNWLDIFHGQAFYCYIACFVSVTHALYPSSSDVIDLTPNNFNKLVINSDEVWIVEFYAPW